MPVIVPLSRTHTSHGLYERVCVCVCVRRDGDHTSIHRWLSYAAIQRKGGGARVAMETVPQTQAAGS